MGRPRNKACLVDVFIPQQQLNSCNITSPLSICSAKIVACLARLTLLSDNSEGLLLRSES